MLAVSEQFRAAISAVPTPRCRRHPSYRLAGCDTCCPKTRVKS